MKVWPRWQEMTALAIVVLVSACLLAGAFALRERFTSLDYPADPVFAWTYRRSCHADVAAAAADLNARQRLNLAARSQSARYPSVVP